MHSNSILPTLPEDASRMQLADITVARTRLPTDLDVGPELGRGTNNRVYAVDWKDRECVLRKPRRRSDTQQRGSALMELRCTLRASQLQVGPHIYAAWCARHSHQKFPSGLYMVEERFPDDLETFTYRPETRPLALAHKDVIGIETVRCLSTLAREGIFVYDLKPSNMVVRVDEDEGPQVRVIDFGCDFCEWATPDHSTPLIEELQRRIRVRHPEADEAERAALIPHVLFVTMMIILSATTTRRLHHDRGETRMTTSERRAIHPMSGLVVSLLDSMQGTNIALVRDLLRQDEVRGVLRHYHGRRCSGTRHTLALARGDEVD
jgi:hypothetical protein